MKALGIAATGMMAQQTNVDVISNNIANANTTGFKSSRASFQDLIYDNMAREGALTTEEGSSRPTIVTDGFIQTDGSIAIESDRPAIKHDFPRASQQTAFAAPILFETSTSI